MIKVIFLTLYYDIVTFFESYFLKASRVIIENFFTKFELLKRTLSGNPIFAVIRWFCVFLIFIVYLIVWMAWIFLPIIISLALYYGRLF
ncbi:MAG: hypothetical protein AAB371_01090 [Patescibacteria group bacterium]